MSDASEVNEIEQKVINRLKKTVTIKKELSVKQQAHLDKLSNSKKGKKYTEVVDAKDVELPVEIIAKVKKVAPVEPVVESKPKKAKKVVVESDAESSEEEVVVVKKPKKAKKKVIVYASESESSEEEVVKPKKSKKPKKKVKKVVESSDDEAVLNPGPRYYSIC